MAHESLVGNVNRIEDRMFKTDSALPVLSDIDWARTIQSMKTRNGYNTLYNGGFAGSR